MAYQLPFFVSESSVSGVNSIIGGTFSPLNVVSAAFSSQASSLLEASAAKVEATVASDSREYSAKRIVVVANRVRCKGRAPQSTGEDTLRLQSVAGNVALYTLQQAGSSPSPQGD